MGGRITKRNNGKLIAPIDDDALKEFEPRPPPVPASSSSEANAAPSSTEATADQEVVFRVPTPCRNVRHWDQDVFQADSPITAMMNAADDPHYPTSRELRVPLHQSHKPHELQNSNLRVVDPYTDPYVWAI